MATVGWTQADIDALRAAIATGTLTVSYAGPPARLQTFQSVSDMLKVLALMIREVNANTATPYRRTTHSKGF